MSKACFKYLDAPIEVMGALNLPAVPMNILLEKEMLPNAEKLSIRLKAMLRTIISISQIFSSLSIICIGNQNPGELRFISFN
jgi:hypothetical protein